MQWTPRKPEPPVTRTRVSEGEDILDRQMNQSDDAKSREVRTVDARVIKDWTLVKDSSNGAMLDSSLFISPVGLYSLAKTHELRGMEVV